MDELQITLQTGSKKGASWVLREVPLVLGRDPECDIVVADVSVSRRHCLLWQEDGSALVRDLDSRNATMIGGRPIQQRRLDVGAEISVGNVRFMVTAIGMAYASSKEYGAQEETASVFLGTHACAMEPAHEPLVEGLPQSIGDLARLFRVCRACGAAESLAALLVIVKGDLQERFAESCIWILLPGASRKLECSAGVVPAAEQEINAVLRRTADRVMAMGKAIRTPRASGAAPDIANTAAILAPLQLRDVKAGVLVIENAAPGHEFSDSDLEYLAALAYVTVPFFHLQKERKELETVAARMDSARHKGIEFIGSSEKIHALLYLASVVADSTQPILILGDTGTGKEVIANLIHAQSPRSTGPMVPVNCAAIPNELFESEVFGHERGAFTGAVSRRIGLLEQSDGGTLFLDEIGDLSIQNQARILRAIEMGRFRRVGGQGDVIADFRILAATNKDLPAAVREGKFREDLYHRLRGLEIRIPALRERREDIPLLAAYFLDEVRRKITRPIAGFTPAAFDFLRSREWPGNVRELRHCVHSACVLTREPMLDVDTFKLLHTESPADAPMCSLAELEKSHVLRALEYCDGKIPKAAELLGIGRSTLYDKIAQYNIQR